MAVMCSSALMFNVHFVSLKEVRNFYSIVGIQHCSCLALAWGPLVLIIAF